MAPEVGLSRRSFFAALGILGFSQLAHARPRPLYGGTLRLTLPLDLTRIDPHDPESLSGTLLGPSLFETLYANSPDFGVFPTLADGLPVREGTALSVRLRPDLSFSGGAACDAGAVVRALERCRGLNAAGSILPKVSARNRFELLFSGSLSPEDLGRLLAEPLLSITAPKFRVDRPEGTGPLRVERVDRELRLGRNSLCPRGGSFLDAVVLRSAPLAECLRAFEAKESALGWLGLGFHETRRDAVAFSTGPLGFAVLEGGRGLGTFSANGVIESVLSQGDRRVFEGLGYSRPSIPGTANLGPGPYELLLPNGEHHLQATGEALEEWLRARGTRLRLKSESVDVIRARRRSRDFDLALNFLAAPRAPSLVDDFVQRALLAQAGVGAPASIHPEKPEKIARRLPLGIVGTFTLKGGIAKEVGQFPPNGPLQLGEITLSASGRAI